MANSWLKMDNAGKTRNMPLSPKLQAALGSILPGMGLTADVFSGGQPEKGSGLPRTGSTRHDDGNAGDMNFYKDGRQLDWRNPADVPIYQQIVEKGRAAGLTGFGAGDNYMSPGSMHVGFGTPGVWGAGGQSKNAPGWLLNAFNSAAPDSGGIQMGPSQGAIVPNGAAMMPPMQPLPIVPPSDTQLAAAPVVAPAVAANVPAPPADPTWGDKLGGAIFGADNAASLKTAMADPKSATIQGMGLLKSGMGGSSDQARAQFERDASTIQPSGITQDDSGQRMQAAQTLMSNLLAKRGLIGKPKLGGMSLGA